jgi:Flp pilus assembly protein TadG
MIRRLQTRPADRRGNVLVLTAAMMVVMITLLAFAVDLGYMNIARTELQRAADAAAMAATWELIDPAVTNSVDLSAEISSARQVAVSYAAKNKVTAAAPAVDPNTSNSVNGDIVVGYIADPMSSTSPMVYTDMNIANAIKVKIRKETGMNGKVPYFFARILGLDSMASQASATAALLKNFGGFKIPEGESTLDVLPFALDKQTWDAMLAGGGNDVWNWNESTDTVSCGSDGVREINLYPQSTGSPGNRGTVDIGPCNNSTADLAQQILNGVTQADLDHIGGELQLSDSGTLTLNGDTGISAGVKDELASIIGDPRIIPIFDSVTGPGNNAQYTIVQFAGVRIMEVKLTGSNSSKRVIIQPCKMIIKGGIPASGPQTSHFIYSPVWLVN